MRTRRLATTLLEFLVFFTIALIVLGVLWSVIGSSTRIGRRAVEGVTLQTGVRNVVEYMVKDVHGAYMIEEPHGGHTLPHDTLVVYRYAAADARRRLELNNATIQPNTGLPGSLYPYGLLNERSDHQLVVNRIVFTYDEAEKTVTRTQEAGTLTASALGEPEGNPRMVVNYAFAPLGAGGQRPRVLARNITRFQLWPAGYDPTVVDPKTGRGRVLDTRSLPELPVGPHAPRGGPGDGPRPERTALVILRIRAEFDKGDDVKKAEDTSTELVTKIWSYPKLYDHMHRPFFSSVDRDLRY